MIAIATPPHSARSVSGFLIPLCSAVLVFLSHSSYLFDLPWSFSVRYGAGMYKTCIKFIRSRFCSSPGNIFQQSPPGFSTNIQALGSMPLLSLTCRKCPSSDSGPQASCSQGLTQPSLPLTWPPTPLSLSVLSFPLTWRCLG